MDKERQAMRIEYRYHGHTFKIEISGTLLLVLYPPLARLLEERFWTFWA